MSKRNIKEELARKKSFIKFLRNSIFLLEDAMNRDDIEDIDKYKKLSIDIISAIIGINSHGSLRDRDTMEEDAKLTELKNSIEKLSRDISDKYKNLPKSLKP